MNAVQKIKARHEAREWADIEGIWRSIKPALEATIAKNRHGPTGKVHLDYYLTNGRIL